MLLSGSADVLPSRLVLLTGRVKIWSVPAMATGGLLTGLLLVVQPSQEYSFMQESEKNTANNENTTPYKRMHFM
jgi:hypothetical protein